jgi:ribosome-binding protein aMBF1 (putative translation factor)
MIRSESEYHEALRRVEHDREIARQQQEALGAAGLSPEELDHAMQPLRSFQAQLQEEVAWYESVRRGTLPPIRRLTDLGRLLTALRIAQGLTQRQLAEQLNVAESVVSRDERNEYHGITIERAQRILDALGVSTVTQVDEQSLARAPIPAGSH